MSSKHNRTALRSLLVAGMSISISQRVFRVVYYYRLIGGTVWRFALMVVFVLATFLEIDSTILLVREGKMQGSDGHIDMMRTQKLHDVSERRPDSRGVCEQCTVKCIHMYCRNSYTER